MFICWTAGPRSAGTQGWDGGRRPHRYERGVGDVAMRHAATRRTTWVCDRMMPPLAIMRTVGPGAVSRHFSSRTRGFSLTLAFREIACFPVRLGSTETRAAEGGACARVLVHFPRHNGQESSPNNRPRCESARRSNRCTRPGSPRSLSTEPFPSWLCFAELRYVGGLGVLTGAPGGGRSRPTRSPASPPLSVS
jgi:hypothetical protein